MRPLVDKSKFVHIGLNLVKRHIDLESSNFGLHLFSDQLFIFIDFFLGSSSIGGLIHFAGPASTFSSQMRLEYP